MPITTFDIKLIKISTTGLRYNNTSLNSLSTSSCCVEVTSNSVVDLIAGISTSISILSLLIILLIVVFLIYNRARKSAKQNSNLEYQDGPESQLEANANSYEQIHLSLSTTENEAINQSFCQPQADLQGIYSCIDAEQPCCSRPMIQENQSTEQTVFDDPTYAIVDSGRKEDCSEQHKNDIHDSLLAPVNSQDLTDKASSMENESKLSEEALEEMYAVVNKEDKEAPPVPPHTVEELYTAVAKNSKVKAKDGEEKALQLILPTLTTKEHTGVKKETKDRTESEETAPPLPSYTVEELYTAVPKQPKDIAEEDKEAPPIPLYTVEELYTAVMKKSKGNVEDGEKAPPIPPYSYS